MTPICPHLLPDATTADLAWAISLAPPWIKVCKPEQIGPVQAAGIKAYWRPYVDGDNNGVDSGKAWAEAVNTRRMGMHAGWPDAIGYRNEMMSTDANVTQWLAYRDALRSMGYTGLVVLGSFGVGNPDWPDYARLLAAQPDALELHEYWDLTVPGSSEYWALRHVEAIKRGLLPTSMPLFIGECGSDGIQKQIAPGLPLVPVEDPQGRRGWQDRQKLTAVQQSANIATYAAGCASSVVAAFCFGDGGTDPNWLTYHNAGTPVQDAMVSTWKESAPMGILGIDVSNNNGPVNWANVKNAGYVFGFQKASEGTTFKDGTFDANWAAMRANGIVRGAYGYVDSGIDPAAQARFFVSVVQALEIGDFVVCDSEDPRSSLQQQVDDAAVWCNAVQHMLGVAPFVYLNDNQATNADCSKLAQYPLILADYQGIVPTVPPAWKAITIWQHTDKAQVPGVNGDCDEDYGLVTLDQLAALGYQGPPKPPVNVPPPDADALAYYEQNGVQVATDHAIWTVALLPLYRFWQQLDAQQSPMADLVKPGPLAGPEAGATWGGTRPAAVVKLTNRAIGVYLAADGTWKPYQEEF